MAILEVRDLKKIYAGRFGGNQVQALKNVTFTVERNGKEVTAKVKLEKASQFENQTEDSSQGEQ